MIPAPYRRRPFASAALALALACAAALAFSCASAPRPLPPDPAVLRGSLPSGVSYRILQNKRPENRILLRLIVNAGSVLEDDDQRGIAHLVEHMAFQGSAHFGRNELVKYFESLGMAFGPDINAYTSYDETVYMLEIPADSPEALTQALTVLADWAGALTFDSAALEKERGVVIEEWRLGRGFEGRLQDAALPFLFEGSRYAVRETIGDPECVRNTPRERVLSFYNTWYRPERLSVVIVGDADPAVLEARLRDALSALPAAPAASPAPPRPEYRVPIPRRKDTLVLTDPESPYPFVQLCGVFPAPHLKTEADYRQNLLRRIAAAALSERLEEKAEGGAPFLEAGASFYSIIRPLALSVIGFIPKEGRFMEAFAGVLDEADRFERFGITEGELERHKQNILTAARLQAQNKDKTESAAFAQALIAEALRDTPLVPPDEAYRLTARLLEGITKKDADKAIAACFGGRGSRLIVSAPEDFPLPPQADIDSFWKTYRPERLLPPAEADESRPLFEEAEGFTPGEVTAERRFTLGSGAEAREVTQFTLSNGAEVFVIPTDFKADSFTFTALRRGGLSLLDEDGALSAAEAGDYLEFSGLNGFPQAEITRKLAGKNLSIVSSISQHYASLSGAAAASDMETYFQLIHLYFSAPYFTPQAWERLMENAGTAAQARRSDPLSVFIDEIRSYRYGGAQRFLNLTPEALPRLSAERAEAAYRAFFTGAGGFSFVFTGDADTEAVKALSARYLASLPGAAGEGEARDITPPFPRGAQTVTVRKGAEPQGAALLLFGAENPPPFTAAPEAERELIALAENLAHIRLRGALREEAGGVYGVSAMLTLSLYPARRASAQVFFSCGPERAEELSALALEELRRLTTEAATEAELAMLRETFTRGRESAARTNGFWHGVLTGNLGGARPPAFFAASADVLASLTAENLLRIYRAFFNEAAMVTGILLPEH